MPKKSKSTGSCDQELLEGLKRHPELRERIEQILALADSPENQGSTADEIEPLRFSWGL